MFPLWLIVLLSCSQATQSSLKEEMCEKTRVKKTALITGAAGFIGHHVIEVGGVRAQVL
jgi:FlaA1/EpsC-like NDP-sugar epimerase